MFFPFSTQRVWNKPCFFLNSIPFYSIACCSYILFFILHFYIPTEILINCGFVFVRCRDVTWNVPSFPSLCAILYAFSSTLCLLLFKHTQLRLYGYVDCCGHITRGLEPVHVLIRIFLRLPIKSNIYNCVQQSTTLTTECFSVWVSLKRRVKKNCCWCIRLS